MASQASALNPRSTQAFRESFSTLREPGFRRLFFGRVLSMLGTSIVPVALAFAVLDDLHGSATDLGLVLGARWLALTVLTLAGGVWADRLPRNVVMLSADLARMASQTVVGVLLISGHAALWQLAVTQTIAGAGDAFFNPASTGIVPHVVPPDRLQQANAFLSLTSSGTSVVGPAIGGALVATAGAGWAFVGDGASFLLSALFLAGLRLPRAAEMAGPTKFLTDLRDGWREFRAQTWMVAIDAWAVVANMVVIAPFFVLGPLVAKRDLGGAAAWAAIVAAFGVGAVVGDLAALVVRPRRPLVVGCLVVTARGGAADASGRPGVDRRHRSRQRVRRVRPQPLQHALRHDDAGAGPRRGSLSRHGLRLARQRRVHSARLRDRRAAVEHRRRRRAALCRSDLQHRRGRDAPRASRACAPSGGSRVTA